MIAIPPYLYYFLFIGIIDAAIFAYDKRCARSGKRRVPERVLHFLELMGGVFIIIPTMYVLHHKNKKFKYYAITYLILLLWIGVFYAAYSHK